MASAEIVFEIKVLYSNEYHPNRPKSELRHQLDLTSILDRTQMRDTNGR